MIAAEDVPGLEVVYSVMNPEEEDLINMTCSTERNMSQCQQQDRRKL